MNKSTVPSFLPISKAEMDALGWEKLDVILVTGDSYIDSPYIGVAVIGKLLVKHGYKVGIIAQPDISLPQDITALGEPRLWWGVSGGSVDSMVANYTASNKPRREDDYTPGGVNNRRPDRAVIKYANLIRQHFKRTAPIVLGGIEASLRRVAHYDFWSDTIKRPLIFDAKADYLIYGMAALSTLELTYALERKLPTHEIKGLCYIDKTPKERFVDLGDFEIIVKDKSVFSQSFALFYHHQDAITAKGMVQKVGERYLVHNPPQPNMTTEQIDELYDIPYAQDAHPIYKNQGKIKALDTIRFSITTHQGCYGECSFCAIAMHQGRFIVNRSETSILNEVKRFTEHPGFKGIINDVGGATANMYGFECDKKIAHGACANKPCVGASNCKLLEPTHAPQIRLLKKIRETKGVKKAFVASGIRYDLILDDKAYGKKYLEAVLAYHTSGQLKIAPEHADDKVLKVMNKPLNHTLIAFKKMFDEIESAKKDRQYLSYYFIAAHPGSDEKSMLQTKKFATEVLKFTPKQTQIFTPTPSTVATAMYHTGLHPLTQEKVFVEKKPSLKQKQKEILTERSHPMSYKKKSGACTSFIDSHS